MLNSKSILIKTIKPNIIENIRNIPKFFLFFFLFLLILKIYYDLSQGVQIFGDKNNSFFDVWSFEHIITGMSISYFLFLNSGPFTKAMEKDSSLELISLRKSGIYSNKQLLELKNLLDRKDQKNKIIHHSLIVIGVSLGWEIIELYMETTEFGNTFIENYFAKAQIWFSGVELFLNRFFIDIILVYFGWYIVRHNPKLSEIAAPISLFWLLMHIISFKDSMFLHKNNFDIIINTIFSTESLKALLITILISILMYSIKKNMKKNYHNKLLKKLLWLEFFKFE